MSKSKKEGSMPKDKIDEAAGAGDSLKPNSKAVDSPKSKVETLKAVVGAANSMTNTELTKWFTQMIDLYPGVVKAPGSADSNKNSVNMKAGGTPQAPMPQVKIKEDMDALFEGSELTEEAKDKITTLFEAAVTLRSDLLIAEKVVELEESYEQKLTEEVEAFIAESDQHISDYLKAATDKWMEDNQVAIVDSLQLENAMNFMERVKGALVESYFDLPEERVDLVSEMSEHVEAVESELAQALAQIGELQEEIESQKLEDILDENAKGLTLQDSEKLKGLLEGVDYVDHADFAKKVVTIREKFFGGNAPKVNEGVETLNEENLGTEDKVVSIDPLVEAALKVMGQR